MILPFALSDVWSVTVYKRDEITTDLICCDVKVHSDDQIATRTRHEEWEGFEQWMAALSDLPGFRGDWFTLVSQPAFATCETVIFQRPPGPPFA